MFPVQVIKLIHRSNTLRWVTSRSAFLPVRLVYYLSLRSGMDRVSLKSLLSKGYEKPLMQRKAITDVPCGIPIPAPTIFVMLYSNIDRLIVPLLAC